MMSKLKAFFTKEKRHAFYIHLHSRYIYSIAVVERNTLRLVDVLDIAPNQWNTAEESEKK